MPSLSVTDLQDGTGATATITGSSGGTVTVYAQQVTTTPLTTPAFAPVGSRTGNGTVALSLAVGYWWVYALEGSSLSALAYASVTDSATALHERCLQAVLARLQGLTLAGLDPANVYDQTVPNDQLITLPAIILSIEGESETTPGTTTNKDDIGYPIRLWLCDRNDASTDEKRPRWLLWRQQIHRALRNQRLAGITEVMTVRVTPLTVIDPRIPALQYMVSGLRLTCLARETRG